MQTHKETSNNTATERTLDAICLGPTENVQGTYKFLNLATNKRIYRNRWTELPVPDWAIKRVDELGKRDKMDAELTFSEQHTNKIADDNKGDGLNEVANADLKPRIDKGVNVEDQNDGNNRNDRNDEENVENQDDRQNVDTQNYLDRDIVQTQNNIFANNAQARQGNNDNTEISTNGNTTNAQQLPLTRTYAEVTGSYAITNAKHGTQGTGGDQDRSHNTTNKIGNGRP